MQTIRVVKRKILISLHQHLLLRGATSRADASTEGTAPRFRAARSVVPGTKPVDPNVPRSEELAPVRPVVLPVVRITQTTGLKCYLR